MAATDVESTPPAASPPATSPPAKPKHALDEWKKCIEDLSNLRKIIVDLRRYGFVMVVTLVTTKTLLSLYLNQNEQQPLQTRFASALFTMLLIYALFYVDRYYELLQWAARDRAIELEGELGMNLAGSMKTRALSSPAHANSFWIFCLFVGSNTLAALLTAVPLEHLFEHVLTIIAGKPDPPDSLERLLSTIYRGKPNDWDYLWFFLWMLALTAFFLALGYRYNLKSQDLALRNRKRSTKNGGDGGDNVDTQYRRPEAKAADSMAEAGKPPEAQTVGTAGLHPGHHGHHWTQDELALLGKLPDDEVACRTHHTSNAVRHKREELGIPCPQDPP
jgi:hypothetical protein